MADQNGNGNGNGSVQTLIATATAAAAALSEANAAALSAAQARLTEIDAERETLVATIATLGGETGTEAPRKARKTRKAAKPAKAARTGKRATNSVSLREAVARALSDKPQSPTEIQEAVVKAGYKTSSPNFSQMVAQHLSNLGGLRMGKSPVAVNEDRGLWTAGSGMERYLADPSAAVEA